MDGLLADWFRTFTLFSGVVLIPEGYTMRTQMAGTGFKQRKDWGCHVDSLAGETQ